MEPTFQITDLSVQEVQAIVQALGKLPWADVNPLIVKIDTQAQAQFQLFQEQHQAKDEKPSSVEPIKGAA